MRWVRRRISERFPAEAGYAYEERMLCGAAEGRTLVVTRGTFELRCTVLVPVTAGREARGRHRITLVAGRRWDEAGRGALARWAAPAGLAAGGVVVAVATALLGVLVAGRGAVGLAIVQWAIAAFVGSLLGAYVAREVFGQMAAADPALPVRSGERDPLPPAVFRLVEAVDAGARTRALPVAGGFRAEPVDGVVCGPLRLSSDEAAVPALVAPRPSETGG